MELNVSQRCSGIGSSLTDIEEASRAGSEGVKVALAGKTGVMVAFKRTGDDPYQMECAIEDVNKICNQEKPVPAEWIVNGNDVSEEFITYARPLIQGEPMRPMKDGLPEYLHRR